MSEPNDLRDQFGEHGEWDALAVGWALSALDAEDEERFADHLPGCARCTATVRESLYTVADLAYALPDEAPPPSLKSRLMAAVAAEPRMPGTAPEREGPAGAEPEEEWPLGEPHPGSPGYGVDWFAKAQRSMDAAEDQPSGDLDVHEPPVDGHRSGAEPPVGWDVDDPTVETRRPDLTDARAGDDVGPSDAGPADAERDPRTAGDEVEAPPSAGPDLAPGGHRGGVRRTAGDEVEAPPSAGPDLAPGGGYRGGDLADIDRPSRDADGGLRDGGDNVVSLDGARRRRWLRPAAAVASAAVLALIAGLVAWNVNLRSEQDDLRQVVAQRDEAIQQLTANEPARVAALTADGKPSPERRATLVVRGDQIEIITETLGATTGTETYWLWTLRCDTPQPTDLKPIRGFTVTQSDFSVRDIGSDPGVASAPCFAISSELGSATPTAPRQVVALGQPE